MAVYRAQGSDWTRICTGVLVATSRVLTSAFCVPNGLGPMGDPRSIGVGTLGDARGTIRPVRAITAPPELRRDPSDAALAVLALAESDQSGASNGGYPAAESVADSGDLATVVRLPEGGQLDRQPVLVRNSSAGCDFAVLLCATPEAGRPIPTYCKEDLGAPVLRASDGALLGIVRAGIKCDSPSERLIVTPVIRFASWLDSVAGTQTGTPA